MKGSGAGCQGKVILYTETLWNSAWPEQRKDWTSNIDGAALFRI